MANMEAAPGTRPMPKRDVLYYLEVPLRRRLLFFVPVVCVSAFAVAFSYSQPKLYRSSTLILVESQKIPDTVVPEAQAASITDQLQTLKQEVLSRTRLERIVKELNPYPEDAGKRSLSRIVEGMRDDITISVKGRDAFIIGYANTDPRKARDVAGRLATLFIEETTVERGRQAEAASDFMASQVEESALALEAKDKALRQFKERHMGSLPDQLQTNLATLQRLQLEQQTVTESLRAARDRQVVVEKNLADQMRVSASSGTDPVSELPQLQSELASLRGKYTDEHPDVQALRARIARIESALSTTAPAERAALSDPNLVAARQQVQQVQLEIQALGAQRDDLAKRIAEIQARVDRVPANEQELQNLTREYGQLKVNYDALLQKRLAAGMAEKVEQRWRGEHFRILDPAYLPERPFYPNRMLFTLAGMMAGLAIGLGLAFGAEALDHSIKSAEELSSLLGYPVLISLPDFASLPGEDKIGRVFGRG